MSNHSYVEKKGLKNAIYVSNDLELKTEMGKHTRLIISTDIELYHKMIQKFPKTKVKVAKTGKKGGKALMVLGIGITVLTGGVLWGVGLPLAGAGAAFGITGAALDDYKHYKLYIDYEEQRLIFKRTKK